MSNAIDESRALVLQHEALKRKATSLQITLEQIRDGRIPVGVTLRVFIERQLEHAERLESECSAGERQRLEERTRTFQESLPKKRG